MTPDILSDFSVRGAQRCADSGMLEEWSHGYLRGGRWANLPLSDGIKLEERFWVARPRFGATTSTGSARPGRR